MTHCIFSHAGRTLLKWLVRLFNSRTSRLLPAYNNRNLELGRDCDCFVNSVSVVVLALILYTRPFILYIQKSAFCLFASAFLLLLILDCGIFCINEFVL